MTEISLPDGRRFLRLLNSLPRSGDISEWVLQFKQALMALLDGVDRVSITIDNSIGLNTEEQKWATFFAEEGTQRSNYSTAFAGYPNALTHARLIVAIRETIMAYPQKVPVFSYPSPSPISGMASMVYDKLKREEPAVANYQEPIVFEFHTDEERHLGCLFLWRLLSKPPIPESTVKLVVDISPFIMFALEDGLARAEYQRPLVRGFIMAMAHLVEEADLLDHEARTLGYLLMGSTYEQIADRMKISVNTVRKYITGVYRKVGVHSLSELYGTYFTPWAK